MKERRNAKQRSDYVSIFETERLGIHSLSWGLGGQSTALVLKAINGEIPRPDCIVFADPMWEGEGSYEILHRIQPMIDTSGIPFHIVSGGDIRHDSNAIGRTEMPFYTNASRYETIEGKMKLLVADTTKAWYKAKRESEKTPTLFPQFQKSLEDTVHEACTEFGKKVQAGIIRSGWQQMDTSQIARQCTLKFKIKPVMDLLRSTYGATHKNPVGQWLGITVDEFHRMKTSQIKASILMYPLIDLGMSREDCEIYIQEHGLPVPPKSACKGCPYHSDALWNTYTDAQIEDVALFEEEVIQMIANNPSLRYLPYFTNGVRVHNSMQPIDDRPFEKGIGLDTGSPCMGAAGCFL